MKDIKYSLRDVAGFKSILNFIREYMQEDFRLIESEEPDYLICSCFGKSPLENDAVRIQYIGENLMPDFNSYDYVIGFHFLEFGDRYLRYPIYALAYRDAFMAALEKHKIADEDITKKERFCSFVVSNGKNDDVRTQFFWLLNKYKQVDSGGRFLNNIGYSLDGINAKTEFQKKHRFSIAFENSCTPGYTTEKLLQAWQAGTIPIYWGNPEIGKEFNTKAFINCHDYKNFDEVVKRVIEIDSNEELFQSIIREPIIFDGCLAEKYIDKKYLKDFLNNIFIQNKNQAFRRTSYYSHFGKYYEDQFKCAQIKRKSLIEKIMRK